MNNDVPNLASPPEEEGGRRRPAPVFRVRFATFEVDLRTGELRKHGLKIKLQDKPFQVLALLLEHPGQLVTREELQKRLWPSDTFVDFDRNLNTAANRLRQALSDSADNPRFIETVPRRGYRLIAPVEPLEEERGATVAGGRPKAGSAAGEAEVLVPPRFLRITTTWHAAAVAAILVAVAGLAVALWSFFQPPKTVGSTRTMLVVLPFENLSGDPAQDYISDGLTEEMITQLGRMNPARLGVIARTSAMRYKGLNKRVDDIGRELGVDYALEGSVRASGGRLRVTAQLLRTSEQTPLWTETYERDVADVISLQREVAGQIARALTLELLPAQRRRALTAGPAPSPEAYEAYLLGRHNWNRRTPESLQKALEYFQRAIEKDPTYARAYVGMADTYMVMGGRFIQPPKEAYPRARAAVQKALEIDPSLGEAHASLATVTWLYDWNWSGAEQEFRRAIELNPEYPTARHWHAEFLSSMGRHAEALAEIERARSLDPLSLIINASIGTVYYQARRYDEAMNACRRTLEMDPDFAPARICLAMIYVQKKMEREGAQERYRAMITEGFAREEADSFWRAYAAGGLPAARRWLIDYRTRKSQTQYVPAYFNAVLYGALGEKDQAFAWLEKGFEQRDSFLVRLKVDPNLDPLRDDPRFASLLRRVNLSN